MGVIVSSTMGDEMLCDMLVVVRFIYHDCESIESIEFSRFRGSLDFDFLKSFFKNWRGLRFCLSP